MSTNGKPNNLYVAVFDHCDEDEEGNERSGSFILTISAPDLDAANKLFAEYLDAHEDDEDDPIEGIITQRTIIEMAAGAVLPAALRFDHSMVCIDESGEPQAIVDHAPDAQAAARVGVRAYSVPEGEVGPFWLSEDYELEYDELEDDDGQLASEADTVEGQDEPEPKPN